jgi:DNA (cytosine-5)-methyltransferase 1
MSDLPDWVRSHRKPALGNSSLSFAGLFSGCGGLDLGAILAGIKPVYAADHDATAVQTYLKNIGPHAQCVDLAQSAIPSEFSGVDLLLGGPPCQGFSSAGPKNAQDPRNKLWRHYLESVQKWQPRVFLMENVPGFRREFPAFANEAEKVLGGRYKIFSRRFVTQYYGVPQFRDRLIIQGVRTDVAQGPRWPTPTSPEIYSYTKNFPTAISMAQALGDLGPANSGLSRHSDHVSVLLGEGDNAVAKHIPNGGSLKDIPDTNLPDPYSGRERTDSGWTWYYRKPRPELPARGVIASIRPIYATILAPDVYIKGNSDSWQWEAIDRQAHTDKSGYYTSPVPQRRLTIRECARLQTFPDWFRFEGTPLQVHRQIGNAVPVEFARRLCEAVAHLIAHGDEAAVIQSQPDLF